MSGRPSLLTSLISKGMACSRNSRWSYILSNTTPTISVPTSLCATSCEPSNCSRQGCTTAHIASVYCTATLSSTNTDSFLRVQPHQLPRYSFSYSASSSCSQLQGLFYYYISILRLSSSSLVKARLRTRIGTSRGRNLSNLYYYSVSISTSCSSKLRYFFVMVAFSRGIVRIASRLLVYSMITRASFSATSMMPSRADYLTRSLLQVTSGTRQVVRQSVRTCVGLGSARVYLSSKLVQLMDLWASCRSCWPMVAAKIWKKVVMKAANSGYYRQDRFSVSNLMSSKMTKSASNPQTLLSLLSELRFFTIWSSMRQSTLLFHSASNEIKDFWVLSIGSLCEQSPFITHSRMQPRSSSLKSISSCLRLRADLSVSMAMTRTWCCRDRSRARVARPRKNSGCSWASLSQAQTRCWVAVSALQQAASSMACSCWSWAGVGAGMSRQGKLLQFNNNQNASAQASQLAMRNCGPGASFLCLPGSNERGKLHTQSGLLPSAMSPSPIIGPFPGTALNALSLYSILQLSWFLNEQMKLLTLGSAMKPPAMPLPSIMAISGSMQAAIMPASRASIRMSTRLCWWHCCQKIRGLNPNLFALQSGRYALGALRPLLMKLSDSFFFSSSVRTSQEVSYILNYPLKLACRAKYDCFDNSRVVALMGNYMLARMGSNTNSMSAISGRSLGFGCRHLCRTAITCSRFTQS